ncbi:hypothetical protein RIE95_05465 [Acidithiobacillus thiooxidans]|uniref:hypothetical protein n=1 Tax=Acidithiobacillus thiooxidans TaxID=930 RepID=UPI00285777FC|nr:hypothetical protein [Acidithiobacillus thiooxidans]MDR7926443.1 hypothetical protein [Acidithiobacillus thiooxidans]
MNQLSKIGWFAASILILAGCSATHDGPPARAAKIAYIENIMGDDHLTKATLPTPWKHAWHRLRVARCAKNASPGQWTCAVYVQDTNGPHETAEFRLIHVGGVWKAYQ